MSFSVRCDRTGLEWGGENLNALFAQRRNMLRPRFLRMVHDIIRFGNEAPEAAALAAEGETLGTFLSRHEYSPEFVDFYLVPMGAAIWSTPEDDVLDYPAETFLRFCDNHRLLHAKRPSWRATSSSPLRRGRSSGSFSRRCPGTSANNSSTCVTPMRASMPERSVSESGK
jgi:predicted NAD/FAD-binding protein